MSAPMTLSLRLLKVAGHHRTDDTMDDVCDYADACERLAKAAISADDTYKRWADSDPDSEHRAYKESEAADDEYDAALAAFRELVTAGGAA